MSRRERLEAKLEKRQEWAGKRDAKVEAVARYTERYRGDHAFNFQPGHIPERARVIRMEERAFEDAKMADHHRAKAGGLADQLERSVFSDDDNAVQALEARIAGLEEKRTKMKKVNAAFRKSDAAFAEALGVTLERAVEVRAKVMSAVSWCQVPYPAYELTNLGARIRADKERIAAITAQRARTAQAEAAGGMLIQGEEYVRVTFAEKPARAILDALKVAGFHWSGGGWCGRRDQIPTTLQEG